MAGAGETPFVARVKEIIETRGTEAKLHTSREIADIAEAAMTTLMKRYVFDRMKELT